MNIGSPYIVQKNTLFIKFNKISFEKSIVGLKILNPIFSESRTIPFAAIMSKAKIKNFTGEFMRNLCSLSIPDTKFQTTSGTNPNKKFAGTLKKQSPAEYPERRFAAKAESVQAMIPGNPKIIPKIGGKTQARRTSPPVKAKRNF